MRRAALLGLLALAGCGARPPRGMVRLDSGSMNHGFAADEDFSRLFYIEGTGGFATSLVVADLESGARASYRYKDRRLLSARPVENGRVQLDAEETRYDQRFRRDAPRQLVMTVAAADGKLLFEEEAGTFAGPPAPPPAASPMGAAVAAALSASRGGTPAPAPPAMIGAYIVREPKPGVRTAEDSATRRSARFFPTPTPPTAIAYGQGSVLYTAYRDEDGKSVLEELDAADGARRPLARFDGVVESIAVSGAGIVLLRGGESGPRTLSLVEASDGRVALELPWTDDGSRLLGVDAERKRLIVVMKELGRETAWAIDLDRGVLRAASDYLAAERAPKKITRATVFRGWLAVIAFLVALASAVSMRRG